MSQVRSVAESGRLRTSDMTLVYETRAGTLPALGPLSLEMEEGEFLAVLGPSGCGKSTLLKILSGLLTPTTGQAWLGEDQICGPRSDLGIVFQQPTLLPWKTVLENVLVPLKLLGRLNADTRRQAEELLAMVGLTSFSHLYPDELSGGMQQRVGIARALVHNPRLLLMDEPFAALDALTREQIGFDMQEIFAQSRKSVVLITHSIPEAVLMADRVLVMSKGPGRIIYEETINLDRPRTAESMRTPEFAEACDRLRHHITETSERVNA